jgi:hypothetical protein
MTLKQDQQGKAAFNDSNFEMKVKVWFENVLNTLLYMMVRTSGVGKDFFAFVMIIYD